MAETAATNRTMTARLQSLLSLVTLVIRILLWPLRGLSRLVFPPNDLDGLSPAVTAKSAQAFKALLFNDQQQQQQWSSTGFAALREDAPESLVLVYLHSPLRRNAKTILERILSNTRFQELLQQPHLSALGCSIHSGQGAQLASMLHCAAYPVLALLQPNASSLQLLFSIQGSVLETIRVDQLVQYLQTALTRHQVLLSEQEMRRLQREQEQELRRQQDEEYQATLRADQERQRMLREEEEERLRQEREAVEREQEVARNKQLALDRARNAVRPAPSSGGTRIRFVLPSGKKLERRFESDETIGALKAYLMLHFHEEEEGSGIERIGLSTNYPKQTYEEDGVTLSEAGLSPQAVLMVQDLDA